MILIEKNEKEAMNMEYIYGAMLLHSAGKKVSSAALQKVLEAAGVKADSSRIKALVASLESVNIADAIKNAAFAAPVASTGGGGAAPAAKAETPVEEEKEEEEEEVSEEEAVSGLGALFG